MKPRTNTYRLWNEVLCVFGPARSTNCFLSIGTGIAAAKAFGDVQNIKCFTESVASIPTNSEITNLLFSSPINAFAQQPRAKEYYRFNVCDGLPQWTEDEAGNWTWKQLDTRVDGGVAEMHDITAIDATEEQAKKYLALAGAQKVIEECAEVLREEL